MPDEFIWEMAWRRAIGIAFLQMAAIVYVFYLGLIVLFFRKREVSFGILCGICAVVPFAQPVGVLLGLIFGWLRAGRWQIKGFMALWTAIVMVAVLDLAAIIVLRSLDAETLRWLFGLPD